MTGGVSAEVALTDQRHPCAGCGNVIPSDLTWCGGCEVRAGEGAEVAAVLTDHRRGDSERDCIEGLGWVWACWCECGWHGRDRDHDAHVADALAPLIAARTKAAAENAIREHAAVITNAEWRAFQQLPEQGYSHRKWLDRLIVQRVEAAKAEERERARFNDEVRREQLRTAKAEALRDAADDIYSASSRSAGIPVWRVEIEDWLRSRAAALDSEA